MMVENDGSAEQTDGGGAVEGNVILMVHYVSLCFMVQPHARRNGYRAVFLLSISVTISCGFSARIATVRVIICHTGSWGQLRFIKTLAANAVGPSYTSKWKYVLFVEH